MQFTSLLFLLVFLPILLAIYYIVPSKYRHIVLLLFNILFYSCGSYAFLIIMCLLTVLNICLAKGIHLFLCDKKRVSQLLLFIGICINIITLGYYKYLNFFINSSNNFLGTSFETRYILLPLGLSFFTFKSISYIVDVYQKKVESVYIIDAATYLSFFAQIQSGPIDRYNSYSSKRTFTYTFFSKGVIKFVLGFCKKILLADTLSQIVYEIFDTTQVMDISTSMAWLGSICFSLQLYYDFSGYSDMAIGICNMLGINCEENFNYPYMTKSFSEFWRRWHISLGSWFRDYVYIPLGGSRVGIIRNILNLFIVWLLTGLWHGAGWHFIVWGLGYFIFISFEKYFKVPNRFNSEISSFLYRIFVLFAINFQWVIFRCNTLKDAFEYIKKMIIYTNPEISCLRAAFLFNDYLWFILFAILFAFPILPFVRSKVSNLKISNLYNIIEGAMLIFLFIISLSFIISGQNSPFLYANF